MVTASSAAIASRVFRELHRHPEIGLRVPRTVDTIERELAGLGLDVRRGQSLDSLVAILHGVPGGPVTVLRADTDALPITESHEHDVRSEQDGAMHACGHDAHAAMLVGAAHSILASRARPPGPVVFIWQPGEEGYDGMGAMLAEGLMETIESLGEVRRTFGLHVLSDPDVPVGVFTGRAGVSHASTATFEIVLEGAGGHAAFPHLAIDPLPACAELVLALNTSMVRTRDPFEPAVLTVGTVTAGDAPNVIAAHAAIGGTFRTYSPDSAAHIVEMLNRVADGIASAHRLRATVTIREGYPSVVNDVECVEHFAEVIESTVGEGRFRRMEHPLPAGDDYARLLAVIPGAFFMLGAGVPDSAGSLHPNHSPAVQFDERVFADGIAALTAIALDPVLKGDSHDKHN